MENKKRELLQLIKDYKELTNKAVNLINEKHRRQRGVFVTNREGYLDQRQNIYYKLHEFTFIVIFGKDGTVSFEPDSGGRCDGFHSTRLFEFARDHKEKYSFIGTKENLEELLSELELEGTIINSKTSKRDTFYYLKGDWDNLNPIILYGDDPIGEEEFWDILAREHNVNIYDSKKQKI